MDTKIKAKVTSRKILNDNTRPASPAARIQPQLSSSSVIRPKAKVNTSATFTSRKAPATTTNTTAVVVYAPNKFSPPRAASPFKVASTRSAQASPVVANFKARVSVPARPSSALSFVPPSSSPEPRQRPFPTSTTRDRRGSTSSSLSNPPLTLNGTRSAPLPASPTPPTSWHGTSPPPSANNKTSPPPSIIGPGSQQVIRVKSKVSRLADVHSSSAPPTPSLPTHKPARAPSIANLRLRTGLHPTTTPTSLNSPSISGSFSPTSPSSNGLPARTRFATTREVQSNQKSHLPSYQPFVADDIEVNYHNNTTTPYIPTLQAKVDPSTIALPPQSPPTSTLSFSSSASRSSLSFDTLNSGHSRSTAPTLSSGVRANGLSNGSASTGRLSPARRPHHSSKRSIDGLGIRTLPVSRQSSPSSSDIMEEEVEVVNLEDRREKAEAKSNRKIADLEITNSSLMAINSTLEAAKHRQAKEIRDLRRRLRESRLILPPPAYRAVKSSLDKDHSDEDDEGEEDGEDESVLEGRPEETYARVKSMLEVLLEQGRKALESTPEDHLSAGKGGAKVLSEEEARTWRGDGDDNTETHSMKSREVDEDDADDDDVYGDEDSGDKKNKNTKSGTSSRILVLNKLNNGPPSSPSLDSEDEVEASLLEPDIDLDDLDSASLPPIRVTHSS